MGKRSEFIVVDGKAYHIGVAADQLARRLLMVGDPARALLVGAVLIPLNVLWIHQLEIVWYSACPTTISLYFNVVFTVLLLMCGNVVLRRFRPGWRGK